MNEPEQQPRPAGPRPTLIIVMGVSGSGKSSVASAVARHYGYTYLDADDYHSEAARARMASGKPLSDSLRAPWVQAILSDLQKRAASGENCTLAFSGLRKTHRETLRNADFDTLFLFLDGTKAVILERMQKRMNHFMPVSLLDSQFETLERPEAEPDVLRIDIAPELPAVIKQAATRLDAYRRQSGANDQ